MKRTKKTYVNCSFDYGEDDAWTKEELSFVYYHSPSSEAMRCTGLDNYQHDYDSFYISHCSRIA